MHKKSQEAAAHLENVEKELEEEDDSAMHLAHIKAEKRNYTNQLETNKGREEKSEDELVKLRKVASAQGSSDQLGASDKMPDIANRQVVYNLYSYPIIRAPWPLCTRLD
jgi:hypothetical protein